MELDDILTAVTAQITAHPEIALGMTASVILGLTVYFSRRLVKFGR